MVRGLVVVSGLYDHLDFAVCGAKVCPRSHLGDMDIAEHSRVGVRTQFRDLSVLVVVAWSCMPS